MPEEKDEGFTVRDRRSAASGSSADAAKTRSADPEPTPSREDPLPEAELSSLILSLAASAQAALGLLPAPEGGAATADLPAAKHLIDLIGVLKEKTKGNLSSAEQELLDAVLSGLRMAYVKAAREGKK